ncbi:conjugal transfer protein [Streptomyces sasae]|uniref:conjugal transfer protein n=1 Tax=Streptomyces sasae TaxID=1266772 RepID=UPI00292ECF19|nr:conjugal transfer protein [Streptomyces sasae]
MKRVLTRRPSQDTPPPLAAAVDEEWDVDEAGEGEDYVSGWSTGARANTSGVMRWALWGLLLISPLLGAAAFLRASTAGAAQPTVTASSPAGTGSQGAAGFATLFVAEYLRAGEGDQEQLAAYYPAAGDLQLEGESGRRHGEQLTVVRLRQTDPDVWSVTVAARIVSDSEPTAPQTTAASNAQTADADATIHYFQVPVAVGPAGGGATGYTALSMPAEVAAPARIKTPDLIYGPEQPAVNSDPRSEAVTEFLLSYLTGTGELDRYLAPGTELSAITPAPYTAVSVDQMQIEDDQDLDPGGAVPKDGTRSRLIVTVRATGHDKIRVPLSYALTLKARAGRWEIASLDGAPSPALPAQAATSASTSTP